MYICICNAVTERHIECAVDNGACRMRDLRNTLGVSADCACCAQSARRCLEAALETRAGRTRSIAPARSDSLALGMEAS